MKTKRTKMKKTDGQILSLVRRYGLNGSSSMFKFIWKRCMKIAEKTFDKGFQGIIELWYNDWVEDRSDHPNRIVSDGINNYILD